MIGIVAATAFAFALTPAGDTTVVLGRVERDLTGDGVPETLSVTAAGPTIDSLVSVTLTIVSAGDTIYRYRLAALTRTVGFDGGRHRISVEEHRNRLRDFSTWFFAGDKFQSPATFLDTMRRYAPGRVAEIPEVMARYRAPGDSSDTRALWRDMQRARIVFFTFSPGGDAVVPIGWSDRTRRFYRLDDCC